jgi:ferredoxin/flavodoxin---NADP+ reductase
MSYDIIIIGAGPGGLTAGIYARSKMMKTLIVDAGVVGGQLVSLYPEKGIHNYPGFESIQARKLSDKLYAQAESMECEIHEHEKAVDILDGDEELIVTTCNGKQYHTKSVVVAIGMGMFKPRRMECAGETELEGKGLTYVLPLKENLVGKKTVVFGGGNSAIEMALIADSVTDAKIVHRRAEFRADESNVESLKDSTIECIMKADVVSFNGKEKLESVTLKKDDGLIEIPADLAVINIGISSDLDDIRKWGLELTDSGLVKVGFDMSTSRNGVFACGDVVDYEGKYKQIVTACGEAGTAAVAAYKFVKKPYWA